MAQFTQAISRMIILMDKVKKYSQTIVFTQEPSLMANSMVKVGISSKLITKSMKAIGIKMRLRDKVSKRSIMDKFKLMEFSMEV